MTKKERAVQLRNDPDVHYNCAQSVLIPFAEEAGMTAEQAAAIGAHFGAGMRAGATCGAVTGALMALGLLGKGQEEAKTFWREFQEQAGAIDCAALLKLAEESGQEKKPCCDGLVLKAVGLLEKYT